mmetsp:Transcript_70267/g.187146  ORF Transcript_70267/g.187146 Transcript_70267/m.187146 type:complete len:251 (-) Transcript_70267:257-1009(-)
MDLVAPLQRLDGCDHHSCANSTDLLPGVHFRFKINVSPLHGHAEIFLGHLAQRPVRDAVQHCPRRVRRDVFAVFGDGHKIRGVELLHILVLRGVQVQRNGKPHLLAVMHGIQIRSVVPSSLAVTDSSRRHTVELAGDQSLHGLQSHRLVVRTNRANQDTKSVLGGRAQPELRPAPKQEWPDVKGSSGTIRGHILQVLLDGVVDGAFPYFLCWELHVQPLRSVRHALIGQIVTKCLHCTVLGVEGLEPFKQ